MFGMGMPEILLILAIALIVIGPKKLPELAKGLGKALGEFKRATGELKASMDIEPGLKDVKSAFDEMNTDIKEVIHSDPVSVNEDAKGLEPAESTQDKTPAEPVVAKKQEAPEKGFENLKQAFDEMNAEQQETESVDIPTETEKGTDADMGQAAKQASAAEREKPESTSHGH